MNQAEVLARWRAAAGPWAHLLKPSLLAASIADGTPWVPTSKPLPWNPEGTNAAVIVDLPAEESISVGVSLGQRGGCLVPMFNTVHDPSAEVLPTANIIRALRGAASELPTNPSGPPVFLLDAGRQLMPADKLLQFGDFDNRWFVFAEDLPSAELFSSRGIGRLLVVSREVLPDLQDALADHAVLQRIIVNPDDGREASFPKPAFVILRGIAKFGRALDRNLDGTFGHRVVSHG